MPVFDRRLHAGACRIVRIVPRRAAIDRDLLLDVDIGCRDLEDVVLSDDKFAIDPDMAGGADGDTSTIEIGALAAGADTGWIIFDGAAWQAGQHVNTASVPSSYTDDCGDTTDPTDSDEAHYYGVQGSSAGR